MPGGFPGGVFLADDYLAGVFDPVAEGRIRIVGEKRGRLQSAQLLVDADFQLKPPAASSHPRQAGAWPAETSALL